MWLTCLSRLRVPTQGTRCQSNMDVNMKDNDPFVVSMFVNNLFDPTGEGWIKLPHISIVSAEVSEDHRTLCWTVRGALRSGESCEFTTDRARVHFGCATREVSFDRVQRDVCDGLGITYTFSINIPGVMSDNRSCEHVDQGLVCWSEPLQEPTIVKPRYCPKHGNSGCMCPRTKPEVTHVRRGTGKYIKVVM